MTGKGRRTNSRSVSEKLRTPANNNNPPRKAPASLKLRVIVSSGMIDHRDDRKQTVTNSAKSKAKSGSMAGKDFFLIQYSTTAKIPINGAITPSIEWVKSESGKQIHNKNVNKIEVYFMILSLERKEI